jgi:hypothetical protein
MGSSEEQLTLLIPGHGLGVVGSTIKGQRAKGLIPGRLAGKSETAGLKIEAPSGKP